MRVFVSTVLRGAPIERGGELLALDWEKKQILHRTFVAPPPPTVADTNTRGGFRGGRGIVVLPDELLVATYHTLLGFTWDLRPTRQITHNNFSGLHELKRVDDGIWVTSTPLGAVIKVGFDGQTLAEWWAHDDPVIQKEFHAPVLSLDKKADNRLAVVEDATKSKLHLNNVECHKGRVYVSLNNHGAVVRLFPTEVIAHRPEFKGCHNGVVTDHDELLLNDSHHHTVIVFDLPTGAIKRTINLADFAEVQKLLAATRYKNVPWHIRLRNFLIRKRMSRPLFTRGMCLLDDRRVLIGVSPASVLEIDFHAGRLLSLFQLSDAVNDCVHGLEAVPSVDCAYRL
jgi:hypothetical protein